MELAGAVVVITGAGHGIGAGLARRVAVEGLNGLVLVDRDGPSVEAVATELRASFPGLVVLAVDADVADAAQVQAFVSRTVAELGRIDLFVANAGIGAGGGLDASDEVWAAAWAVNVMAHVVAARLVVPAMVERGGGAFVTTASAAGLLTNLGNAPYSVTKHGAVAFAEWLAITYGDQGLYAACICPMGIDTDLLRSGQGTLEGASVAALPVLTVPDACDRIVDGILAGRFLILTHPETSQYEQNRAGDRDRWIAGMRRVQRQVVESLGPARMGP